LTLGLFFYQPISGQDPYPCPFPKRGKVVSPVKDECEMKWFLIYLIKLAAISNSNHKALPIDLPSPFPVWGKAGIGADKAGIGADQVVSPIKEKSEMK